MPRKPFSIEEYRASVPVTDFVALPSGATFKIKKASWGLLEICLKAWKKARMEARNENTIMKSIIDFLRGNAGDVFEVSCVEPRIGSNGLALDEIPDPDLIVLWFKILRFNDLINPKIYAKSMAELQRPFKGM